MPATAGVLRTLEMKKQPVTQKAKRKPPVRRTNAERSAQTRAKLIQAAIDVLFEKGYAAATTIEVAKRAEASRGAMLHHFPTRVDLLLATAAYIIAEQRRYRSEKLAAVENNWTRFAKAADVTWEVQRQPATIALLEIMLGSRSDNELRKRLTPFLREMTQMRAESAARLAETLGVNDVATLDDLILIHNAALRGLTMNLMFTHEHAAVEEARQLLTHYEHTFARGLMGKQGKTRSK